LHFKESEKSVPTIFHRKVPKVPKKHEKTPLPVSLLHLRKRKKTKLLKSHEQHNVATMEMLSMKKG